ncbi:LOW QUALITY PROTEIN: hypothetical protein RJ640_023208, partial [Escallonia rubra]
PNSCLPKQLPNLNLSNSPFEFTGYGDYLSDFYLFNCSPLDIYLFGALPGVGGYQVYAIASDYGFDSTSCVKISGISSVPYYLLDGIDHQKRLHLAWSKPSCKLIVSYMYLFVLGKEGSGVLKKLVLVAVLALTQSSLLLGTALYYAYASRRKRNEDRIRIDKFLEDYKALKPTRYSLLISRRSQTNSRTSLARAVHNDSTGNGDEFINEVGTMARIHHVNVVCLVGFCADGTRRALVYEFLPNHSLEKFIFSKNQNSNILSWEKLQDIALGIAKGIICIKGAIVVYSILILSPIISCWITILIQKLRILA